VSLVDIEKPKKDTTIMVSNVIKVVYRDHAEKKNIDREF